MSLLAGVGDFGLEEFVEDAQEARDEAKQVATEVQQYVSAQIGALKANNPRNVLEFKTNNNTFRQALQAAVSSGEKAITLPLGETVIDGEITNSMPLDMKLSGQGKVRSTLKFTDGANYLTLPNGFSGELSNFSIVAAGQGVGIYGPLLNRARLDVHTENLFVGIRVDAEAGGSDAVPWGSVIVPSVLNCGMGIWAQVGAEYMVIANGRIEGCSDKGILSQAGNTRIVNLTVNKNNQGIVIQGGLGPNSDHGGIYNSTINHNSLVGVFLNQIEHGFSLSSNQIWATIGPRVGNDYQQASFAGYGTTFGLFIRNSLSIQALGNKICRNRVNVGVDGMKWSKLEYFSELDSDRTTSHYREYGTGSNIINEIDIRSHGIPNVTGFDAIRPNYTGQSKRVKITHTSGFDSAFKVLTGGAASDVWYHSGLFTYLTLKSDYAGKLYVPPLQLQNEFELQFESVNNQPGILYFVDDATLTSENALAQVLDAKRVQLWATGTYRFTPTSGTGWRISCTTARTGVQSLTLQNGWVAYANGTRLPGFYKDSSGIVHLEGLVKSGANGTRCGLLPAGYRPSVAVFSPANTNNSFGSILIDAEGYITVNLGNPAWVSLEGISFRAEQ